jgi:hypothetical protein
VTRPVRRTHHNMLINAPEIGRRGAGGAAGNLAKSKEQRLHGAHCCEGACPATCIHCCACHARSWLVHTVWRGTQYPVTSWRLPLGEEDGAEQQDRADLVDTIGSCAQAVAAAVTSPFADGVAAAAHKPRARGTTGCQLRLRCWVVCPAAPSSSSCGIPMGLTQRWCRVGRSRCWQQT